MVVVDPGVVLESSGAEGFRWPFAFSGVGDFTLVSPGPAVAGLSPFGPDGSTAGDLSECASGFVEGARMPVSDAGLDEDMEFTWSVFSKLLPRALFFVRLR